MGRLVVVVVAAGIAGAFGAAGATAHRSTLVLPKASTPGAFNPAVRQSTIDQTICVHGWTKTIRPPASYTNRLKVEQMPHYGETDSPSGYEEDHLIPLELGGAPRDPHNLWPEPRNQARHSDQLETQLKHRVCDGAMTLAAGRTAILQYKRVHG